MVTIPDLVVGTAARHRALSVLPLYTEISSSPHDRYRIGCEALLAGVLDVHEVDGGAVDRLIARNRSGERMLLLEGEHLVGARQNRVLTSSTIIGPRRSLTLPVSCVEHGRWHGPTSQFSGTAPMATARLRCMLKQSVTSSLFARRGRTADQSGIWGQIASQQRRLRVTSATQALSQTFMQYSDVMGEAAHNLAYADGATGLAIGISGELLSIDLFDSAATCRFYWRRLVESAALDAIAYPARELAATTVNALVDEIRSASWIDVASVGEGREARVETANAAASALVLDGSLVHFGVAPRLQLHSRGMHRANDVIGDRYRIVARVGVGGAKEVFRATDMQQQRDVAIARVPWADAHQFMEEVELARRVRSPYVPEIYDAFIDGNDDGYLVMEYCDGKTLAELAAGGMPVADAAPILVEFARGVAEIHEAHVLHRDVKPENVLLCPRADGIAIKIIDFGLSARARDEITAVIPMRDHAGTLPYMPREALVGEELDARSDVYSFGVSCYRILVGTVPVEPRDRESSLEYMQRLHRIVQHDLSRLPVLPEAVRDIIARMLDVNRERRPFMPEVVAVFERTLGAAPIKRGASPPPPLLYRTRQIELPLASPDHLLVAPCAIAPLVALAPSPTGTTIRTIGEDGNARWTRQLDVVVTAGIRADLDGDGVREIYLAGPDRVVSLSAGGALRFSQTIAAPGTPTLIGIPDRVAPCLVVDGRRLDPRTGQLLGPLLQMYEGDHRTLVEASAARGLSFNGHAMQAFRGDHETAAAIIQFPGVDNFHVAHLEQEDGRVRLAVYGPGGRLTHTIAIAERAVPTGSVVDISRVYAQRAALFGAEHAPLAVRGANQTAIVIVPLLGADAAIASSLTAVSLPEGRVRWRLPISRGRVVLGTIAGRTCAIIGDGANLTAFDASNGTPVMSVPCTGVPVAVGDPFGLERSHVVTVARDAIEIWRGAACGRNDMQWSGLRGDLWRSATLGLGPV